MKTLTRSSCVVALLAVAGSPAMAHHSYGMFDRNQDKTIAGTVESFAWTNPHAWVHVMVPDSNGQLVRWSVEMGPPGQLARTGWTHGRNTLKPGDKVEIILHPLVDGSPGGHLRQVKAADGQLYYDSVFRPAGVKLPQSQ